MGALGSGSNRRYLGTIPTAVISNSGIAPPIAALRVAHVKIDKPVRQISMKDTTACCVTDDGEVWHWGNGVFLPQLVREVKFRNLSKQVKGAFCGTETVFVSIGRGGHNTRRYEPGKDILQNRARCLSGNSAVVTMELEKTE